MRLKNWMSVGAFTVACSAIGIFLAACGSSKDDDDKGSSGTPASMPSSYTATCAIAGCHGSDGSGIPDGRRAGRGVLKGTTFSESEFIATVRAGVTGTPMLSYGASTISDAELRTVYSIMKN